MELMSDFLNISNNRPPRETCFYQHKLLISYETDEKELSVTINNLPPGLTFNQETKTILGTLEDFNLWHPCKDYILNSIKILPDDSIPFLAVLFNVEYMQNTYVNKTIRRCKTFLFFEKML